MSDLTCPYCMENVPRGATVCRRCRSEFEVEYGPPPWAYLVVLIASIFTGIQTDGIAPETLPFLGWAVGVGVFVGGCLLLSKIFKNSVRFNFTSINDL